MHIIRELHTGELVTWEGEYFRVDSARIWDAPDGGVPIGLAVSGDEVDRAVRAARRPPDRDRPEGRADRRAGTSARGADAPASRKIGQIPICWAPDKQQAIDIAHEQFRWFGGRLGRERRPADAARASPAASQFVRKEDVAESIACGPDLDELVEGVRPFWEAGFTDVALVQVGDELQQRFLDEVAEPLLEKLRAAAPKG